jgi:hypothetical protein
LVSEYSFTYDADRELTTSSAYTAGGGTISNSYQYANGDITEVDQAGGSFYGRIAAAGSKTKGAV